MSDSPPPIGNEEERLANLYVASWQLNGTLDLREVVAVVLEILLNLVGADRMVFYVPDAPGGPLHPVASHGAADTPDAPVAPDAPGIAAAVETRRPWVRPAGEAGPLAVIPFVAGDRMVGVLTVESLLAQKEELTALDGELFDLLARQGASSLYGAYLAGRSAEPVTAAAFRERMED